MFLCLALLIISYTLITAISIVNYGNQDNGAYADVAIVLGAGTNDGNVSPVYRERINHAVQLYEKGRVQYLVLTGGTGEGNTVSDAFAAKQYAVSQGVPEGVIFIEETSTITEENLQNAKAIMEEKSLDTALIVSDPLHMKRAMAMADDYGFRADASPTTTTMYKTWKTKLPFLAREIFFYTGYRIVRIFR